jgi:hypothetical protein
VHLRALVREAQDQGATQRWLVRRLPRDCPLIVASNMSPYLDARHLSVEQIETKCRLMARHLDVDVFKIMGGEPLLHPEITRILEVLKTTGISRTIRLFTNGLLLHRMDDAFWRAQFRRRDIREGRLMPDLPLVPSGDAVE